MKQLLILLSLPLLLNLGSCMKSENPISNPVAGPDTTWKLTWSDEFNTTGAPSAKNWTFENGFVRNNELQWYQPDNARCENGLLVIEGKREQRPNPNYKAGSTDWKTSRKTIDYTSASMNTSGLQSFKYGRFEMRGRIDARAGLWPAFWTLGVAGEWPSNGEIDIMEYYKEKLLANVAWGTDKRWTAEWRSKTKTVASLNDPDWSTKFHVWRMDWTEESIKLYVDDLLLNTVSLTETINKDGSGINPFHQPHYILLNLAIGGDNGGDPANTPFPTRYEVDYVRVYQR
ncbi:glycoside hydrolase family 16 protein [Spirosoma linguale]|uniref:Glycoside hydrolase family 16 n=1 Tax=Spirosoma linguale (strain ATCC 33905 / DSM 74 / LMG 10896 / Claus 1) TaxID=504472 RepID=D2QUA9_SPILD|nr:glycoside hydrolase family 16 [Spirosoma linguale DSM 74]